VRRFYGAGDNAHGSVELNVGLVRVAVYRYRVGTFIQSRRFLQRQVEGSLICEQYHNALLFRVLTASMQLFRYNNHAEYLNDPAALHTMLRQAEDG